MNRLLKTEDRSMLNISKSAENGKTVIVLEGRLDTVTAPDLENEIKGLTDESDGLVLDFEKLEYISSAGLRVLLSAQKSLATKGGVRITGANENIMEIFEVTGFTDILNIG